MTVSHDPFILTEKESKRLKYLKKERKKFWNTVVPRSKYPYTFDVFYPMDDEPNSSPIGAYCYMKDFSIIEVKVWVHCLGFKVVEPKEGTAYGRVWPTEEGAILAVLEKLSKNQRDLIGRLYDVELNIELMKGKFEELETRVSIKE